MREILFGGYTWEVKHSEAQAIGPGPNYFSNNVENVFIDEDGCLMLSIQKLEHGWSCAEVVLDHPLGFGEYRFTLESDVLQLSDPVVCAAFLYENDSQEIDIEFSVNMVGKNRGQYVIQPGSVRGNLTVFPIQGDVDTGITSHSINWTRDGVQFKSWSVDAYGNENAIAEWDYRHPAIHAPEHARFIFNLWLFRGKAPAKSDYVRVRSFSFVPASE